MSRVFAQATEYISCAYGVGGNLYVWSLRKETLFSVCRNLQKSVNSIYFNYKHQCWVVRVKSKRHKKLFKEHYGGVGEMVIPPSL